MKSELKNIEIATELPCLMEYKIQGEISAGIYLVRKHEEKYSICLVCPDGHDLSELGMVYFKTELDMEEWFFLPSGTEVTLTN